MLLQEATDKARTDRARSRHEAIEAIRKRRTRKKGDTSFQTAPTRRGRGTRKRFIF